jgi:pyridinium-3,5-bisthiocarboxylic acid mononucleotide nickel chelatase
MHVRPTEHGSTGRRLGEARQGVHLHFNPVTGVAGDMAVAGLVDAGVPPDVVLGAVDAMRVPGLVVGFKPEESLPGLYFEVSWAMPHHGHTHGHRHDHAAPPHAPHHHRPYAEIRRMLQAASLPGDCRALAEGMFARLAAVEARIHNQAVEDVTFHEVGAFDSIADIVAAAAAIVWLAPTSISASPPLLGSGTVECSHGTLPVPAPATAGLLAGFATLEGGEGELTTPTGALVLTSLVQKFGPPPPLRILSQGYGVGTKRFSGKPNGLAVVLGEIVKSDS